MSEKYKIHDNSKAYFIIMITAGWVRNIELYRTNNLEELQKELEKYHPLK